VFFASNITSSAREQSIVTGMSGIHVESCIEAIAAGDGREVMQFVQVSFVCPVFAFSLYGIARSWAAQGDQIVNMAAGTCAATRGRLCSTFVPAWLERYVVGVPLGARSP
jgi:hypothetical protein